MTHSQFMKILKKINEIRTVYDSEYRKKGNHFRCLRFPDTLFSTKSGTCYNIAKNLYISEKT